MTDWLETIKPRVRETAWVSYRMAVERITRQIGAVQLQALTPLQVEGLYATLLERGGAGGRALAPRTVRNCHIVLRRALADDEGLGLVTRNPAAAAKAISAPRAEQKTWSSEEIERFFDAVADALRAHRTRQLEERLAAADVWSNEGDLVFTDELGGPVYPDRFSTSFDRIVRDAELPRIRLHDLRHSYATLALKAGVHPEVVFATTSGRPRRSD